MQPTLADEWAERYGETMTKTKAARVCGVSRQTVYRQIERGNFDETANGRVFTRSVAAYYEAGKPSTPKKRKERTVRRERPMFYIEA